MTNNDKDSLIIYEIDQNDLRKLEQDLNALPDAMGEAVKDWVEDFGTGFKNAALIHFGADSPYANAIKWVQVRAKEFVLDIVLEPQDYSAIVEFGRSDLPNYPSQELIEKALDRADESLLIEKHIDRNFEKLLGHVSPQTIVKG